MIRAALAIGASLAAVTLHGLEPQPLYRHDASRVSMACVYAIEAYGTAGDALDNAFFVLGREPSRHYRARLSDVEVFFFPKESP